MNRELRRFYAHRAKTYIVKHTSYNRWIDGSEVSIGILARTPARCSRGWCCGNPRKYQKDRLTIQELKQLDSFRDWLNEVN